MAWLRLHSSNADVTWQDIIDRVSSSLDFLCASDFLCNPAFTEAAYVRCHSHAFAATLTRLNAGEMDLDAPPQLRRTASHHSTSSAKSQRSQTVRIKPRRYATYMSSSASSISSSDKSLTSFPSFSPESTAKEERTCASPTSDGKANKPRKPSDSNLSIVESLTTKSPSQANRTALFADSPLSTQHVPGAIHLANDEHIERLITRNGAVALVRQVAEDLAQRDAQISTLRRKAEERERALRKIILECGLSNLDLETRLRAIEGANESKATDDSNRDLTAREDDLEGLMSDAMSDTVVLGSNELSGSDATIRATDPFRVVEGIRPANASKGWKEYIWGTSTSRISSRANSINEDATSGVEVSTTRVIGGGGRRTVMHSEMFQPPDTLSPRTASRASSIHSGKNGNFARERKPSSSLASLALKLVAGTVTGRDADGAPNARGRASSTGGTPAGRSPSVASAKTTMSARTAPVKPTPRPIPTRRTTASVNALQVGANRGAPQDRWDTMGASPQSNMLVGADNYGPVEMDTILPLEAQPPTLTQINNNHPDQKFLTDRFGFIYDQRRKKRQREAAERIQKSKRTSRVEMLSSARSGLPSGMADEDANLGVGRPDTPLSIDERGEDGKPAERWQDYLKIATFPTELLSHTPSGSLPAFEVMEGGEVPKSPGITTEERGFFPSARTPAISVTSESAKMSKDMAPPTALSKEDAEPVKLLLQQLGEVHDSLQREKTVKWNDFLRKVRAERKREGEAAAAAFAAAAETGSQRQMTVMPEVSLADGEMIGVAGLGNKGKVGRAKWNEFKMLVLAGIPVAYRAKIWAECSGATALRIPGYYDDLVARREEDDDPTIVAQIRMDINRTLTDNIFFREGPGVAKLNEVLLAYSRRNEEVGYCQGMNLITAYLLLVMPTSEDTFWVLTSIIENILPRGYYDHSLLASRADQQVLRQYVAEILPKLSLFLDELSIELEALTFQWFLSVFTDCLSAEALFRVWDVVFCTNDGSTFLFQVALALLKLNEVQLLQCSTPASVYTYINHQMTNHAISIDGLIHASEGLRKVVKRDEVESRRAKAIEAEKDLIRQREARNLLRKAERLAAANAPPAEVGLEASTASSTPFVSSPVTEEAPMILVSDDFGEQVSRRRIPAEEETTLVLG